MGLWWSPGVVIMVVVADRLTKLLAVRHPRVARGSGRVLRLVINERLSLAARGSPRRLIALWLAAVVCGVGVLGISAADHANPFMGAGVAAAIAGAASNLVDRLTRGSVVDFIAIGWWPVFNLADVAIVGGAVVAVLALV